MRKIIVLAAPLLAACLFWVGCSGGGYADSGSGTRGPSNPPPPGRGSGRGPGRGSGGEYAARPPAGGGGMLFQLPSVDGQSVPVQTPAALFFFTTWCGYCKQAMPEIKRLADRGRARGWHIYGIDVGEGAGQVSGFVQQYQPNFPVLLDQDGSISRQYGVKGYPTFVVLDANGRIIYNGHDVPRNF